MYRSFYCYLDVCTVKKVPKFNKNTKVVNCSFKEECFESCEVKINGFVCDWERSNDLKWYALDVKLRFVWIQKSNGGNY